MYEQTNDRSNDIVKKQPINRETKQNKHTEFYNKKRCGEWAERAKMRTRAHATKQKDAKRWRWYHHHHHHRHHHHQQYWPDLYFIYGFWLLLPFLSSFFFSFSFSIWQINCTRALCVVISTELSYTSVSIDSKILLWIVSELHIGYFACIHIK